MIGLQRLPQHVSHISRRTIFQSSSVLKLSTLRQLKSLASHATCVSSVDRQQLPQCQSIRFSTKWFSSTSTGDRNMEDKNENSSTQQKNFGTHAADGEHDYGYVKNDGRFDGSKPTIAYAKSMPCDYSAMRHEQILQLSVDGDFGARREALTRNVMGVDGIEYDEAGKVVDQIWKDNHRLAWIHRVPYQAGFVTAVTGGMISFPLIFSRDITIWFNDNFVTTDVPPPKDLETFLEVSIWSWNWMEPMCGQVSFVLLVLQFARSQLLNLGIKPFSDKMKQIRSDDLVQKYPQYNSMFVKWYSEGNTLYGSPR